MEKAAEPSQRSARSISSTWSEQGQVWAAFENRYSSIIPLYSKDDDNEPALKKSDVLSRARQVHEVIFSIMYGQDLFLDLAQPIKMTVELLADIIAYADLYCILELATAKLEQQFMRLPELWKDVSLHSRFYLGVGYHLRSLEIFTDAMKHVVGQGFPQHSLYTDQILDTVYFPDEILKLEDRLRAAVSYEINDCVKVWSKVLACRAQEMTYEKPIHRRPLNPFETKVRHLAKSTIMSWIMINILGILDFDRPAGLVLRRIRFLNKAVQEQAIGFLGLKALRQLATTNAVPYNQLTHDLKTQLSRLKDGGMLCSFDHGSLCAHYETDTDYSHSFVYEGYLHDCSGHRPWRGPADRNGFDELEVEIASQEWLDLVGIKADQTAWQKLLDEEAEDAAAIQDAELPSTVDWPEV